MSKSEILSKWQITIPKDVREELKLQKGDNIKFQISQNEAKIIKDNENEVILQNKATVTEKGQITIPKDVREELRLDVGDILVFRWINYSIFFRKQGNIIPCPACNGIGTFENFDLPCFICDQTASIENNENGLLFLLFFNNKFGKYGVSNTLIQQEIGENEVFQYRQFPKLILRSNEYPVELLNTVQDKLQLILVEERTPKSNFNVAKFKIPNDAQLKDILDLFITDEAKNTVKKWFRYNRTI